MVAAAKQRNFVFTALSPVVLDKVQSKRKPNDDYAAVQEKQQSKKVKTNHYDNSKSKKRLLDILT